jgi:hypothetical protein
VSRPWKPGVLRGGSPPTGRYFRRRGGFPIELCRGAPLGSLCPGNCTPILSYRAPYSASSPFHQASLSQPCAAVHALLSVNPYSNVAKGATGSAVNASGGYCLSAFKTPTVGSWASTQSGFVGPGFKLTTSGVHRVGYVWQASWTSSGWDKSTSIFSVSQVNISLIGKLWDNTTSTWLPGAIQVVYANSVGLHSKFSSSGSKQNFTITFNGALTAADQYMFYTELYVTVRAVGGSTLNACAHADVGSAGYGAWLRSIKLF